MLAEMWAAGFGERLNRQSSKSKTLSPLSPLSPPVYLRGFCAPSPFQQSEAALHLLWLHAGRKTSHQPVLDAGASQGKGTKLKTTQALGRSSMFLGLGFRL